MNQSSSKVFVSYSQESVKHADRVLALTERLRTDGIDAILDQYEPSPEEGWPLWTERQVRESRFVLMVCTEMYFRRVMGEEKPGTGRGVRWEGNLIRQHLYDAEARNRKFIPILFEGSDPANIPTLVKGATFYWPETEEGYEELYRRLTDQPRARKPSLGKLRELPPLQRRWVTRPQESHRSEPKSPPPQAAPDARREPPAQEQKFSGESSSAPRRHPNSAQRRKQGSALYIIQIAHILGFSSTPSLRKILTLPVLGLGGAIVVVSLTQILDNDQKLIDATEDRLKYPGINIGAVKLTVRGYNNQEYSVWLNEELKGTTPEILEVVPDTEVKIECERNGLPAPGPNNPVKAVANMDIYCGP